MNISDTGTRQFMGGLCRRKGNIQGVSVSYTDTRQYLGGLGTHQCWYLARVIRDWHQTVCGQSEQQMRSDTRQFMGLGHINRMMMKSDDEG